MLIEAPGEASVAEGVDSATSHSNRPSAKMRWRRDTTLVEGVRRGNPRAFDAIYQRHHAALLSYCRHLLGCQHEAEDAVQQTFLNAYAAISRDDRELKLRPWLYRIAHNHCISVLRRRRERTGEEIEISTAGLSSEVERREEIREMLRDIAHLPHAQREALILSELETLSHAEISEVIGCPEKRVKALVFQARTTLGKCREAREISCEEIREQLSVLRGGALRRSVIRRHLLGCEGCRDFKLEVHRQRAAAAILLPAGTIPGMGFLLPVAAASMGGSTAGGGAAAGGAAAGAASGSSLGTGLAGTGVGTALATAGASALPVEAVVRRIAAAGVLAIVAAAGAGGGQHVARAPSDRGPAPAQPPAVVAAETTRDPAVGTSPDAGTRRAGGDRTAGTPASKHSETAAAGGRSEIPDAGVPRSAGKGPGPLGAKGHLADVAGLRGVRRLAEKHVVGGVAGVGVPPGPAKQEWDGSLGSKQGHGHGHDQSGSGGYGGSHGSSAGASTDHGDGGHGHGGGRGKPWKSHGSKHD